MFSSVRSTVSAGSEKGDTTIVNEYVTRRAELEKDAPRLHAFFDAVFGEEAQVGLFAENLFRHHPDVEGRSWYLAEDAESGELASACALIPWCWRMENVRLKVAEMAIVGTGEKHRNRGLMRRLRTELMETVRDEGFDLVVIEGIPGFYDRLGFRYALPLCSHVELPLQAVSTDMPQGITVRPVTTDDIPFLIGEDDAFAKVNSISSVRKKEHWLYMLNEGQETECGSDFLIFQDGDGKKGYARIPRHGFGDGLIVSEASEGLSRRMAVGLLCHSRRLAEERGKPYIRFDLHPDAPLSRLVVESGGTAEVPYAWQVAIPDRFRLLTRMVPVLEKRLAAGPFRGYSGEVRLDFFSDSLDLVWRKGRLEEIRPGGEVPPAVHFCVHKELFPALCLGHRSWRELRRDRPDIFPALAHVGPRVCRAEDITGALIDTLFPARRSWINLQF